MSRVIHDCPVDHTGASLDELFLPLAPKDAKGATAGRHFNGQVSLTSDLAIRYIVKWIWEEEEESEELLISLKPKLRIRRGHFIFLNILITSLGLASRTGRLGKISGETSNLILRLFYTTSIHSICIRAAAEQIVKK
jgi:hypothetical protein